MNRVDSSLFLLTFIDSFSKNIECAHYVLTMYQVMKRASEVDLDHSIQVQPAVLKEQLKKKKYSQICLSAPPLLLLSSFLEVSLRGFCHGYAGLPPSPSVDVQFKIDVTNSYYGANDYKSLKAWTCK